MRRLLRPGFATIILIALVLGGRARGDEWDFPTPRTTCSESGRYCVTVHPRQMHHEPDGTGREAKPCLAVFRDRFGHATPRAFRLVNEVAPVSVIVSDDGRYVATFDNWSAMGYGPDVVAIYRSDGTLVRALGLADLLTSSDVAGLDRSMSSIWWAGEHRFDLAAGQLVVAVVGGWRQLYDKSHHEEVRLRLTDGQPVEIARNLFSDTHLLETIHLEAAADVLEPDDEASARVVSSLSLLERANLVRMPAYPLSAAQARAEGLVVVRLLVDDGGHVEDAQVVQGEPPFDTAVVEAARHWQLTPEPRRTVGRLGVRFRPDRRSP